MIEKFKDIYFLSVFLILLPPFFILNPTLNVHRVAGVIWVLLFLLVLFEVIKGKVKIRADRKLLLFFSLYIVAQSLSIIGAQDIEAFFRVYEDIFFPAIFFILSLYFVTNHKDIKKVIFILFCIVVVNLILQATTFFRPSILLSFGEMFLHPDYLNLVEANLFRGRIFIENYDEILIPIIVYSLAKDKAGKIPLLVLFFLISFFSFFSGFRTKFLMLAGSLIGSAFVFRKQFLRFSVIFLIFMALLFFIYRIPFSGNYSIIDRLFTDETSDIATVTTGRIERWSKAVEIGLSSPVFGVGLGNYYDYLSYPEQKSFSLFKEVREQFNVAARDPHNIFFSTFAETGFLGLGALVLLLSYFFQKDIGILKGSNDLSKTFTVSFWTLFIFALLNPSSSIIYQTLFWLLRAVIEKSASLRTD